MYKNLVYLYKPFTICRFYSLAVPKVIKNKWKSVIGLEIHAQIASESKLFSGSKVVFGAPLNSCVSLFDASVPGTLPVLNRKCVEAAIITAVALNCNINSVSMFDRKHYFYADMPAGYQITQQRSALANNGTLTFPVFVPGVTKKPYEKTVRLHQLQLEQDSGKSLHDDIGRRSLVDLNRAGVPLIELVFDPDLEDSEEAAALIKELILIFKSLGTCSCRMEEGALRVDANVSIHQTGEPYGTRTEIKNIGSVRGVAQAIAYEIQRQIDIKDSGGSISNETRSWDAVGRKTIPMRDKEVQQDYRFMPEPNLPPLRIDLKGDNKTKLISVPNIAATLPELPKDTRTNLIEKCGLTQEIAIILVNEPILLEYFLEIKKGISGVTNKSIANFLINDLLTLCNKNNISLQECKITSTHLIELMALLQNHTVNIHLARIVLDKLYAHPEKSTIQISEENDLKQIIEPNQILELCQKAISSNPKAVEQYQKGKKKVLFAIVGDVAKLSNNRANMELVVKKLEELLKLK